ncbi:MAG: hypothetical protein WC107_03165 [Patescibacteria group bacterium]
MKLTRNLFFLFAFTVFGITSVILDIFNYNPEKAGLSEFANFYTSFFAGILGTLALIIFVLKVKSNKIETYTHHFWPSVRQAFLLSAGLTTILMLRGFRILDWMIGASVIIVVVLLELFFQTKKQVKI